MYIPVSFQHENQKHQSAMEAILRYYPDNNIDVLPGKNNKGYDFTIEFESERYSVELKTNKGENAQGISYPTWLLETYCDHDKTKLPEWRSSSVQFLIIVNLSTRQGYIYDAEILRSYVSLNINQQVSSGIGTGQYLSSSKKNGWGIKIPWIKQEAGFIKQIDLR